MPYGGDSEKNLFTKKKKKLIPSILIIRLHTLWLLNYIIQKVLQINYVSGLMPRMRM